MSVSFKRLAAGGRIERSKPLTFTFDGKKRQGFQGDTLASALLAAGDPLIGRSFKYHRPRGIYSAGVEEPNALFTLGEGATQEPNIPGTLALLTEGMKARSQNGRPSLKFDLMAVNQLFGKLLGAGFYYKTFMGPKKGSWMFYEPFIRKAAGLGEARHGQDAYRYDTHRAFTDVLVIGSGPSGLAAALAALRAGAQVTLVDQDAALGGSLLSEAVGSAADAWRRQLVEELEAAKGAELLTHTTAFGLYDGNTVGLLQRADHLAPDAGKGEARQVLITLTAKAIVFATGAIERPLVFANNDRPGVMLASAARSYLHRFAVAPNAPAVVATNNDSAYATAIALARAGVPVTLADWREIPPAALVAQARAADIDLRLGSSVIDVTGGHAATGVILADRNGEGGRPIPCGLVAVSGGWSPAVHLTSHAGIKPVYNEEHACFLPGGFAAGHFGAGSLIGHDGPGELVADGLQVGEAAARHAGFSGAIGSLSSPPMEDFGHSLEAVWQLPNPKKKKAFVDLQNDVTVKDVAQANDEGYRSVEHLKRYTTLGMGTDQGKTSNINALAIMAGLRDVTIPEAGTTTFRPPYTPVTIGALAGRAVGHHFRPTRFSPLHEWNKKQGGRFIEAGPWLRCWYYDWAGKDAAEAYVKEMELVRKGVGLADVSTLGKIDVQGPDAAEFLNRLYVNPFAKLPVGKARYGVMLNDDGLVLDDGTTTRLSETRYFMTTTTAQAGEVMSWLEFLLETAWTDLKVHVASLTDAWAGLAVSGPLARKALELAFPGRDLGNEALPYMGCLEFDFDGVPIRLIRLSFSGELAYEVYTPTDFGPALADHLLQSGLPLGMKPYGLEALASLRIEKGHVAGLELDHRTSLDDLALGKMAGKDKAYVGKELRFRENLQAPERWSLVGIECLEEGQRLHGGAILFAVGDEIKGHGRGYITSVTFSTELKKYIALGLYNGGQKHIGDEILCVSPVKNHQVRARVVSPHFIDQKGERLYV